MRGGEIAELPHLEAYYGPEAAATQTWPDAREQVTRKINEIIRILNSYGLHAVRSPPVTVATARRGPFHTSAVPTPVFQPHFRPPTAEEQAAYEARVAAGH